MPKSTLDYSVQYMQQHPEIGGLGVKVVLADGTLDHACKRGFPTPWNSLCYFAHLDMLFPKIPLFNGYRLGHLDNDRFIRWSSDRRLSDDACRIVSAAARVLMKPFYVWGGFRSLLEDQSGGLSGDI